MALDPHKWLYAPLEAGCTLVKDPEHLRGAFSFTPEYYTFADRKPGDPVNFFELGMQNSRGFRALKVWLGMKQVGLDGYRRMIGDDVHLSRELFNLLKENEEIEAVSNSLSITTFRYVPPELSSPSIENDERLNSLNREVLDVVQRGGEAFVSNAIIRNRFLLRTCIVNFRTTYQDISALPDIIVRAGRQAWTQMS